MRKIVLSGFLICSFTGALNASPVNVSYDNGTVFEVAESGFKNRLNIGIKAGYTYSKLNQRMGSDPDSSSFDVGLARLQLQGESSSFSVGYKLQGDFAEAGLNKENDFQLSDALVWWQVNDWVRLSAGQMKQGLPAQYMADDFLSQFYVRDSLATQFYSLGRNQGVSVRIMDPSEDSRFSLNLGIFNGESQSLGLESYYYGLEGQNRPGVDTKHRFLVSGRYNVLGRVDHLSESDFEISNDVNLAVSAGYSYSKNEYEFESGSTSVTFNDVAVGAHLRYQGFSLNGELFWRDYDPDDGEGGDGIGYYVQAGYFVMPETQIYGRFSGLDCKAASLESGAYLVCDRSAGDDVFEYSAGVSYHLGSRYHRIGAEYSFVDFGNSSSRTANDDQRVTVFLSTYF